MLAVRDIHAGYGKKEVLRGVSLTVQKSEISALIGPNGAGKTTFLKAIAGMIRPAQGRIELDGQDITGLPIHERVKAGVAYFMQGGQVFPSLTVQENLVMGAMGLSAREGQQAIGAMRELFPALQGFWNQRAGLLSGGQRQQVALAMVLIRKPELLLLDEPSAGLAPNLVEETMERTKNINHTFGTAVLLVEQNIRAALQIAHRAFVLVNGQVRVEYDEPKTLVESGELEDVFFRFPQAFKKDRTGEANRSNLSLTIETQIRGGL